MAIDLQTHRLLTFAQAACYLPHRRNGRPTHPATIWRWASKGVVAHGRRVYLEVVRLPSGATTTIAALEKFLAEIAGDIVPPIPDAIHDADNLKTAVDELDRDGV